MRAALSAILVFLILANASPVYSDDFFGSGLSAREQYAQGVSIESLRGIGDSMEALRLLMLYEAFAEGRCDDYFEIESKAKNGDGESQHILSDLYSKGYCVPQDDEHALFWVREAAEGGYSGAYFDLGYFLLQGKGTSKNPRSAAQWLEKATDKRMAAYYLLALIYVDGEGVPQNFAKAYEYAITGAAFGDPPSQALVAGLSSQSGYDFSDAVDAYKWALIAKASGQENVVAATSDIIKSLESTLTPKQIAGAQDAAINWVPKEQNPKLLVDPTTVTLPILDDNSTINLSLQQASSRLAELGLDKDRFLFFKAIAEDNLEIVALYIQAGASPETVSPVLFRTPLLQAAEEGSERVVRHLLALGVDINRSINHDNDTPVLLAISRGHREVAGYLIDEGAKLDHAGIMYNAVEFNDPSFLALLKSKGVAIDEDYVGTPLSHAISSMGADGEQHCLAESAEFLIENGARIDTRSSLGESLVNTALNATNPYRCVALLLKSGASLSAPPGQEPLFYALMLGNADLVELMLEHGADPNLRIDLRAEQVPFALGEQAGDVVINGGSLLQVAVAEQHATIARLLVRYGADPTTADRMGRSPLSVARANGDSLMLSVLEGEM